VTFADVAGVDEAKEELAEIVDFLKYPKKYQSPGRADSQRRPAVGPARDGQDAARAGDRRRGGRSVPLDIGLRFRGDVRGVGASRVRDSSTRRKVRTVHRLHRRESTRSALQRGAGLGGRP